MAESCPAFDQFQHWLASGELRRAGAWLVERYAREVLGLCSALTRDRQSAEDLCQEVFISAFARIGDFRGEASLRGWILTIARNRCIDHIRARSRRYDTLCEYETDFDAHAVLPTADQLAERDAVEDALDCLSDVERALVLLRFREGLSHAEIAEVMGIREGAVRMRLSRALTRIRSPRVPRARAGRLRVDHTPARTISAPPPIVVPQRRDALSCPGARFEMHLPPQSPNAETAIQAWIGDPPVPSKALGIALDRLLDALDSIGICRA